MLKNAVLLPCASQQLIEMFVQFTEQQPELLPPQRSDASIFEQLVNRISLFKSYMPDNSSSTSGSSLLLNMSRLVEDPDYQEENLAFNNIFFRHPTDLFPEHIRSLVNHIGRVYDYPGLTEEQLIQRMVQYKLGPLSTETEVEDGFKNGILPAFDSRDVLRRIGRYLMDKDTVPNTAGSNKMVGLPIPDVLYGYNDKAFPNQQFQVHSLRDKITTLKPGLIYPFLVAELKGFTISKVIDPLQVAKNQCIGYAASCVNIAEHLNSLLKECRNNVPLINSAIFSIAMNGTIAKLYVCWKHNESYYMQQVEVFPLEQTKSYLLFCSAVRHIVDWGKNECLTAIRNALDNLFEDQRKIISEVAKSRSPLLDDDFTSNDDRHKAPRLRKM
jgi:hypothetical protein